MLLKKIKFSLYLADAFPAIPPLLFGNCFPIGFICSLRLVSSRLVKELLASLRILDYVASNISCGK